VVLSSSPPLTVGKLDINGSLPYVEAFNLARIDTCPSSCSFVNSAITPSASPLSMSRWNPFGLL